jgi:nitrite reductase (NADH) small subunit
LTSNNTHNLGSLSQIPPGEGRVFEIGGTKIALFHDRSGRVFATQPDCPHAGGPLADGLVGDGVVICPLHERIFDLASGKGKNADCRIKSIPSV